MNTKAKKVISVYEMLGGIIWIIFFGLWYLPTLIEKLDVMSNSIKVYITLIVCVIMIGLYIMSFVAGILLWKNKKVGITLSYIIQVMQIPYILIPGFTYTVISGLQLGACVIISSNSFLFKVLFYIGSTATIYVGNTTQYILLGINIMPIIIMVQLRKIKNGNIKNEEIQNLENNISNNTNLVENNCQN